MDSLFSVIIFGVAGGATSLMGRSWTLQPWAWWLIAMTHLTVGLTSLGCAAWSKQWEQPQHQHGHGKPSPGNSWGFRWQDGEVSWITMRMPCQWWEISHREVALPNISKQCGSPWLIFSRDGTFWISIYTSRVPPFSRIQAVQHGSGFCSTHILQYVLYLFDCLFIFRSGHSFM